MKKKTIWNKLKNLFKQEKIKINVITDEDKDFMKELILLDDPICAKHHG